MTDYMDGRQVYERDGFRWLLKDRNLIDYAIIHHGGVWEPYSSALIKRLVQKDWLCLDVGANLGYYTLWLSRLARAVHAFEPMAEARHLLAQHVEMNAARNVRIWGIAVGEADHGLVPWHMPYTYTMQGQPPTKERPVEVRQTSLDVLAAEAAWTASETRRPDLAFEGVRFIKIDTDGHDFVVLRGAEQLLAAFHPAILVEVGESTLRKVEGTPAGYTSGYWTRTLMRWLWDRGYDFFYEYDLKPCEHPDYLLARVDLERFTTNLLCLPRGETP